MPADAATFAALPSTGAFASAAPNGVTFNSSSVVPDGVIGLAFEAEFCRGCGAGCGAGEVDLRNIA